MRPKRLRSRCVLIPQKTVRTQNIGDFRVNLVCCEHNEGDEPRYDIFMWDEFISIDHRITDSLSQAEECFDMLVDEAYVLVAKEALGVGAYTPNEL